MRNWLDKFHDAQRELRIIARDIEDLALAFGETGSLVVKDKLQLFTEDLTFLHETYKGIIDDHVLSSLLEARENFFGAMNRALDTAREDKENENTV